MLSVNLEGHRRCVKKDTFLTSFIGKNISSLGDMNVCSLTQKLKMNFTVAIISGYTNYRQLSVILLQIISRNDQISEE